MAPPRYEVVTHSYPPDPGAVAEAREMVRRTCIGWRFATLCDDAEAVVSELVTNSVRYARTAIEVTLRRRHSGFQMEVADGNPETPRLSGPPDLLAEGGRGLLLVQALTDSWTVEPGPAGKRVCARFCAN